MKNNRIPLKIKTKQVDQVKSIIKPKPISIPRLEKVHYNKSTIKPKPQLEQVRCSQINILPDNSITSNNEKHFETFYNYIIQREVKDRLKMKDEIDKLRYSYNLFKRETNEYLSSFKKDMTNLTKYLEGQMTHQEEKYKKELFKHSMDKTQLKKQCQYLHSCCSENKTNNKDYHEYIDIISQSLDLLKDVESSI